MSRVIALVQARMGSTRLPGKVLMHINGHATTAPMVARVLHRVHRAPSVNDVVLCLSNDAVDEPLRAWAARSHTNTIVAPKCIPVTDVLDRLASAAQPYPLDTLFLRITADCPLIDPWLIGQVIASHHDAGRSVVTSLSVSDGSGWPDGLDVEVFNGAMLANAAAAATGPEDREHVTGWMRRTYGETLLWPSDLELKVPKDIPMKWSVDTQEDLDFVRDVYTALGDGFWGYPAVVSYLGERKPHATDAGHHEPVRYAAGEVV